jgi:hypothetical protein
MQEASDVIRMARLLEADRKELAECGPYFCISHRFWKPGTICTPGEMIAEVRLFHRNRRISLPLSLRLMLIFDYLARHQHLGQCAAQIAVGLSGDPFAKRHGAYATSKRTVRRRIARTAVKQQIIRLRAALRIAFREAGLNLNPNRVVIAEKTVTNEVRYCLKACVSWEHFQI